jgi:hypothetical protein
MSISFICIFFKEVLGSGYPFGTNTPINLLFNPELSFANYSVVQSTHSSIIYFQYNINLIKFNL